MKNKVASAYNALPSWSTPAPAPSQPPQPPTSDPPKLSSRPPPPIPPRRHISSYPTAAAHYATNRISGGWGGYTGNDGSGDFEDWSTTANNDPVLSKKEELWMRRWERAKGLFEERGVVLRCWRVGEDAADVCVGIVEEAMREDGKMQVKKGR